MNEVESMIAKHLSQYFRVDSFPVDADIFAMGLVNSLFALELVLYVEKTFMIEIGDADLERGNFRSARAMADLIVRKRAEN